MDGVDLADWAGSDRGGLDALLLEHRALLFRGFGVRDVAAFERFIAASSDGNKLEYRDRTTPRETRGHNVYTSTVHPPEERIHLHNEGTYWVRWAARLYFCVLRAPERGGETPIADVRRVHDRVPADVRERFEQNGMMLVRNFNQGFGLPWQDVFQTSERPEVEAYCRAPVLLSASAPVRNSPSGTRAASRSRQKEGKRHRGRARGPFVSLMLRDGQHSV